MLDLGAQVNTQSTQQSSSIQSNNLTINVGDGKQDTTSETSQTATQQTKQEQTKREDATASVGVGVGGDGSGGTVVRSGDSVPTDDGFFNIDELENLDNNTIVVGIGAIFIIFLTALIMKNKRNNGKK